MPATYRMSQPSAGPSLAFESSCQPTSSPRPPSRLSPTYGQAPASFGTWDVLKPLEGSFLSGETPRGRSLSCEPLGQGSCGRPTASYSTGLAQPRVALGLTHASSSASGTTGSWKKSLKPPKGLSDYVGVGPRRAVSATSAIPEATDHGPLRFISACASQQHPIKRDAGYIYADAVVRAPRLLGVCDGVSGVQQLGLKPDELPRQLLEQCSKAMDYSIAAGEVPSDGDGHWLMTLLQDAYDRTIAWGATTVLLAAMEDSRRLVVANVGDCGLLALRPQPSCPSKLCRQFRTDALRYEANKPVQVMRLGNTIAAETHLVIQGARVNTVCCCRGDLIVLGSDGIFDNLRDEEIALIVEKHCTPQEAKATANTCSNAGIGSERPRVEYVPTVRHLEQAAASLVAAAIANVRVDQVEDHLEEPPWEAARREKPGGNADDTTAIVAVVVEADDLAKATQEESHQAPRPSFRVGSRRGPPLTADAGAKGLASWAAGGILGLSGIIPQCCNTSADQGEEFEEYLLCKDGKQASFKEAGSEQQDEPEQCAIS